MNPTAELIAPEVRQLIQSGQFSELRLALHGVHPADVADLIGVLDAKEAAIGFRFLHRDDAAAAFAYLSPEQQQQLIASLTSEQAAKVLEAMSPDDRAGIVDELPQEVAQRLVNAMSAETRRETQAILNYPPQSVGRIMTPDYVRVRPDWTVAHAIEHIRKHGRDAETIDVVYVVDEQERLVDDVRLRQLFLADPERTVDSIMNRSFVTMRAGQDREEAVRMMARYDRVALPVVDSRGALLGIVTHDDVADVAQAEATEDIQKMGGVAALEQSYMQTGHREMFKKRGVWLGALFVGQTITIIVLGSFQDRLVAVLVLFLPLVISCGGNSGSQAATLVTRALALGEVKPSDWWRVVRKEFVSAMMLGSSLAVMGFACVEFFTGIHHAKTTFPHMLAATVAAAIFAVVMWGTTLGSLLPLGLRKLKIDPATASTPMVATLMDASGTLIYLGLAIIILSGTVLVEMF